MPNLLRMSARGYRGLARAALPTFTNVNNAAIVTGAPPAVTGISGNFFRDPASGKDVMMNDGSYLRCGTILAAAATAGRKVAMITAKEKLRDILSRGMTGIAFSAEKADAAKQPTHGIDDVLQLVGRPKPEIYSADASLFVLRAGVALLRQKRADFLYLSLTDYMQHKYGPADEPALRFYEEIDVELGHLVEGGAIVAATADHGMSAMNDAASVPRVIYLQTVLQERFGPGLDVICPITDPYVVHHGALGSLVMVHAAETSRLREVQEFVLGLQGVSEVYTRQQAVQKLQLPADRIGDLVVLAAKSVALGKTEADHELRHLKGGLRSHGGRYEEIVPLVISEPLSEAYLRKAQGDVRNFDVFDFACNGMVT